jgi:hypothetical protein
MPAEAQHSNLYSDQHAEKVNSLPENARLNIRRTNWLKNSALSKSMPIDLKPGATAEDEFVSSMRTFRYHKLDASNEIDLPGPLKFVQSSNRARRLIRSQSEYDFDNFDEPTSRFAHAVHSSVIGASSSSRLRASLFIDDIQLLRPPSLAAIDETLMSYHDSTEANEKDPYSCQRGPPKPTA